MWDYIMAMMKVRTWSRHFKGIIIGSESIYTEKENKLRIQDNIKKNKIIQGSEC